MNCLIHGSYPNEGSCSLCIGVGQPQDKPKRIRKDNGKRARKVSVERMQLQARTILAREMDRLMMVSYERALARDEAVSLRGYIELLNELEELDKIAKLEKQEKKDK
jgi:hypothetical protein